MAPQAPFPPPPGAPPIILGREEHTVEYLPLPDGQVRERHWVTTSLLEADGKRKKLEEKFVLPPLGCGCADAERVGLCLLCRSVVCVGTGTGNGIGAVGHMKQCSMCLTSACINCVVLAILAPDSPPVILCRTCAEEVEPKSILQKVKTFGLKSGQLIFGE